MLRSPHIQGTASITPRRYATTAGQTATVRLTDGTRVVLAPETQLVVGPRFGTTGREVSVLGEAYFSVARVAGQPFTVRTGGVTARVLGTQFTVRHYASEPSVRVAVVSGKIVMSGRTSHVLTPGSVGQFTDSTEVVRTDVDTRTDTEWVSGRLVFFEAPASEVLQTLTRWYGYEFRLADPAQAEQKLTVALSTESSSMAFASIKLLLNAELSFNGNLVTITPRRARSSPNIDAVRRALINHKSEVGR
jgi:transmembrane sensor